jgi:hypothetical protein
MPYRKDLDDKIDTPEDETMDNSGPAAYKSAETTSDRTVLFTIDDEEYTVPTKPGPNVTLKFLDELRRTGNEMFAALSLLESMLGKEKYQEFLNWDGMEDDVLTDVLSQVTTLALARTEDNAGK